MKTHEKLVSLNPDKYVELEESKLLDLYCYYLKCHAEYSVKLEKYSEQPKSFEQWLKTEI